jgi:hypothetical protein
VSMRAEVHKGGDDGLRLRWLLVAIEAVGQWEVLAGKEGQAGAPGAEGHEVVGDVARRRLWSQNTDRRRSLNRSN